MAEGGNIPGSGPAPRERRDPQRQAAVDDGRRASDPRLSTSVCAARLGVTPKFILGEIVDGRLSARVRTRPGVRAMYRISEAAFDMYVRRFWPAVARG